LKIAILASGDGWHVRDLARAASTLGHEVAAVSFRRLQAAVAAQSPAVRSGTNARHLDAVPVELSSVDRVLVRTMPAGSLEQVIFRMDVLHRLVAAGVPVLNPPRALETAVDKYLACCRMEAAGLPVPPTIACENADDALAAFGELGGDVVVKPLFGSEGKGITRVTDADVAHRVFKTLERLGSILYVQKFIAHDGSDLRAFVLGDRVLAAMRRRHDSDWRTNVARGAIGEPAELSPDETNLALRAAQSVGAPIAGVDLLRGRDGRTFVLEVNAVPGWRALAKVTGRDVAANVLAFVADPIRKSPG
jgi:ribosomal protein S6--L-glutamate ligase